jgi:hypothetical protein
MPKCRSIGPCLCILSLILLSCRAPGYQSPQLRGYGEIQSGEAWVAVESAYQSPSREMVYYDPKSVRRDGNLATLWQLIDYKVMQGNAPFGMFMMSPHRFFSTKTHKEFNCIHKTVRLLASSEFFQHMGTGTHNAVLVEHGHGQPLEPGSINQVLWEVACGAAITPE